MRDKRESAFRDVERFLLDLGLLLMLMVGLWRVVAPEVREVFRDLFGENRPASTETQTPGAGNMVGHGDLSGGR